VLPLVTGRACHGGRLCFLQETIVRFIWARDAPSFDKYLDLPEEQVECTFPGTVAPSLTDARALLKQRSRLLESSVEHGTFDVGNLTELHLPSVKLTRLWLLDFYLSRLYFA
jgi:hypothetical protein